MPWSRLFLPAARGRGSLVRACISITKYDGRGQGKLRPVRAFSLFLRPPRLDDRTEAGYTFLDEDLWEREACPSMEAVTIVLHRRPGPVPAAGPPRPAGPGGGVFPLLRLRPPPGTYPSPASSPWPSPVSAQSGTSSSFSSFWGCSPPSGGPPAPSHPSSPSPPALIRPALLPLLSFPSSIPRVFPHRLQFRHHRHHRGGMYDHGRRHGGEPRHRRRGRALGGLLRGPVLSHLHQRPAGVRRDGPPTSSGTYGGWCAPPAVPFLLSCAVYLALGLLPTGAAGEGPDAAALFSQAFRLGPAPLLPAAVLLLLALRKVDVKRTMLASIAAALVVSLTVHMPPPASSSARPSPAMRWASPPSPPSWTGAGSCPWWMWPPSSWWPPPTRGSSRARASWRDWRPGWRPWGGRTTPFFALLCTAAATALLVCNQSLCIMLTRQMCAGLVPDRESMALTWRTPRSSSPPWSPGPSPVRCPLSTLSAPALSLLAACYLYLVPLWQLRPGAGRPAPAAV